MQMPNRQDGFYRLYTLSAGGSITGAQNRAFLSDAEALSHARRLLHSHFGVELWQTNRLVGRVERAGEKRD
jgi:hypothetical protein